MTGFILTWILPGGLSPTTLASSLKRALSNALIFLTTMTMQPQLRPDHDPPENISVFRSISTLLSYVPRAHKMDSTDNLKSGSVRGAKADAVKIMDAFTQLANTGKDVTAAAANADFDDNIKITACIQAPVSRPVEDKTESSVIRRLLSYFLVFVRNDRILDPTTQSEEEGPTLIDAEPPSDLGDQRAIDYIVGLQTNWRKPTFSSHLWLLANSLSDCCSNTFTTNVSDRPAVLRHLFRYVASTCHSKILSRLTDNRISNPFLRALKSIPSHLVPLPSQSPSRHSRFKFSNVGPTTDEISRDHQFLHHFIARASKHGLLGTLSIPNLTHLANQATPPNIIYNDATSKEFHKVFVHICQQFEDVLRDIQAMENLPRPPNPKKFESKLHAAQTYAYALLRLVRGHALNMHLSNISNMLDAHHPVDQPEAAQVPQTDANEERDEDLDAIQPGDRTGPLRLALSQFEAIEIIMSFLTRRAAETEKKAESPLAESPLGTSITVHILVSPLSSSRMYPWRRLLANPVYFPAKVQDIYSETATIDNMELIDWLEGAAADATRVETLFGLASSASQRWTDKPKRFSHYVESIQDSVSQLAADGDLLVIASEGIDLNKTARNLLITLEEWFEGSKREKDIGDSLLLLSNELNLPSGSTNSANQNKRSKKQNSAKGAKQQTGTGATRSEMLHRAASGAFKRWNDQAKRLSNYDLILHSVSKLVADGGLPLIETDAETIDLNQIASNLPDLLKEWRRNIQQMSILETNISESLNFLSFELRPPSGFTYLANLSKLDKEVAFKGATHCEASLATFLDDALDETNSKYAQHLNTPSLKAILTALKDYKRVIGVSKRCCPICSRFLVELNKWAGGEPFTVHGSHITFTPCTLPLWTPSEVVDAMNEHFAKMLRQDLLKLKKHWEESADRRCIRNRSKSTASATISPCGFIDDVAQY